MEGFVLHLVLAVVLVTHRLVLVDSCTCLQPDPYEEICMSDFAINATVLSEEITYPDGSAREPWDFYDVRYELDIHDVLTPSTGDVSALPTVLESFGPTSLCGLSLSVNSTYILAGYMAADSDTGKQVLGMMLCNLRMYVTGPWGSWHERVENVLSGIDCDKPNGYGMPNTNGSPFLRRGTDFTKMTRKTSNHDKKASLPVVKATRSGEGDQLRAFLSGLKRSGLTNGIDKFFSAFTGKSRRNEA